MSNRELAIRWFDEIWNHGRSETIDELMHPEAVLHECGVDTCGLPAFHTYFERISGSFSNMHLTIHDAFEAGDKVVVRWSCRMLHTGPGLGFPATGKHVETTGISILRVADGQFVEAWQNWDMAGVLEAIEVRPRGTNALAYSA